MAPPCPGRRLRLPGGFHCRDAIGASVVCASGTIRNRCAGSHALSNAYRDCYVGSLAHIDSAPFPNEHSPRHGCADGYPDADPDRDAFSHSDTLIDSHAPSYRTLAVANRW